MKKHLDPSTLAFIRDLRVNNQREWFEVNRSRYEDARQDFILFLTTLLQGATEFEPALEGQAPKDLMFRIYRDVRFSHDKRPYKDHICAYLAEGGRKTINPGFYLHISPNDGSFLAGGVWMPPAPELKAIRQEIDYNYQELKELLNAPAFKKYFVGLGGDKLKTTPKGYDSENPAITLLRHKSWNATYMLTDDVVTSDRLYEECLAAMQAVKPVNDFFLRPMKELKGMEV
ncbi:DUF2461 domain-containing protein [Rufibacter glacialis]|uniref:DUF2461 domain-containing protein n=1 Tax=Rufibacter glacialis TaxID=1259555 RepID=A0A5M8QCC9_9BACT|nr:DUF2461 domain-containing protein [Rufibacter glacialis]KAA6432550.1 DUF2461 domain-containing protein [Rufibacter glacialis]GGK79735.1 TIGR02453 family protein [Rufibacter glacialis]